MALRFGSCEFSAQVITPGFRVVVSAGGDEYDYRIGQDTLEFRHCEDGEAR